jgi:3-dehydroquinate dehydratase-2
MNKENKILLIHGANLNLLGCRNAEHYGSLTLKDIEKLVSEAAQKYNCGVIVYQSNHEGNIIDKIQLESQQCLGIIINPGAFTHYSYAIHDALLDTKLPVVEIHLSDVKNREEFRRHSVIAPACIKAISGKKELGYIEAVDCLMGEIKK